MQTHPVPRRSRYNSIQVGVGKEELNHWLNVNKLQIMWQDNFMTPCTNI